MRQGTHSFAAAGLKGKKRKHLYALTGMKLELRWDLKRHRQSQSGGNGWVTVGVGAGSCDLSISILTTNFLICSMVKFEPSARRMDTIGRPSSIPGMASSTPPPMAIAEGAAHRRRHRSEHEADCY